MKSFRICLEKSTSHKVLAECLHKPAQADAQQVQRALDNAWLVPVDDPIVRTSLLTLDRGEQTALEFALQHYAVVLIDEKCPYDEIIKV